MLKAKNTKEVTDKLLKYITNLTLKSNNPYFIERDVKIEMENNYEKYLQNCKEDSNVLEEQILPFPQYLTDYEGFVLLQEGDLIPQQKWRYALIRPEDNSILKIVDYYNPSGLMEYYSFIPPWPGFYIKPYNAGIISLGLEFEDSMDYAVAEKEGRFLDFTLNSQTIDFKKLESYIHNKYGKIYDDLKILLSGKPYLSLKQIALSLKIPVDINPKEEDIEKINSIYSQQDFVIITRKYLFKNQDANGLPDSELYDNPGIILFDKKYFLDYKFQKSFLTAGIIENDNIVLLKDVFFERNEIKENTEWAKICFDFVKNSKKEENVYLLKCYKS